MVSISKKPDLPKAIEKGITFRFIILRYIWPSLVIIFGSMISLAFYIEKKGKMPFSPDSFEFFLTIFIILIIAVVTNSFYYYWIRKRR